MKNLWLFQGYPGDSLGIPHAMLFFSYYRTQKRITHILDTLLNLPYVMKLTIGDCSIRIIIITLRFFFFD